DTVNIGNLVFGFFRSGRSHALLSNILFAGSCRLYHLINCAVVFFKEMPAEINSAVINDLRFLESNQIAVAAMHGYEPFGVLFGCHLKRIYSCILSYETSGSFATL